MSEKDFDEKINKLSMMEQNFQYLSSQRQGFQNQIVEIDSAIEELESSKDSFRIIGNVMVQKEKNELKKELESKKEIIEVRVKSIQKQENDMKAKADSLRDEVMKNLEKNRKGGKE